MAATKTNPVHLIAQAAIGSGLCAILWASLFRDQKSTKPADSVIAALDAEAAQSSAVQWGLKRAPADACGSGGSASTST